MGYSKIGRASVKLLAVRAIVPEARYAMTNGHC